MFYMRFCIGDDKIGSIILNTISIAIIIASFYKLDKNYKKALKRIIL